MAGGKAFDEMKRCCSYVGANFTHSVRMEMGFATRYFDENRLFVLFASFPCSSTMIQMPSFSKIQQIETRFEYENL